MKSSFLLAVLLTLSLRDNGRGGVTSVDAFLSSSSCCENKLSSPLHTPASSQSSPSQLQGFWNFEMGGADAINESSEKKKDGPSSSSVAPSSYNNNDEFPQDDPLLLVDLMAKATIILLIKTAKDIVNYPPNLLDQYNRNQQIRNQEIASQVEQAEGESVATAALASTTQPLPANADMTPLPFELTKSNPFILLAKFLGVLTFKTMHDSLYYPALWIHNWLNPQRDDDDYYYYY